MKKFLWLLLLIPISINAKVNVNSYIECQEELTIGSNISCKLIINNSSKAKIKEVNFEKIDDLLNIKSNFDLNLNDNLYKITLDSEEENIDLLNFNFLMKKNNSEILIDNINITTSTETVTQKVSKTLTIKNAAYVDQIYINNNPIVNINRDIYNYVLNIYERTEYIELKIVTSGENKTIEDNIRLIKYSPNITFRVANESDTETYTINLNYKNANNIDNINIKEIPFKFNPNKKSYYLEVENSISKINVEYGSENKEYFLNYGNNNIKIDANDETYNFVINRLKSIQSINTSSKLKSIKMGNTYLNLKDDVYEYNYAANKLDIVTIETANNQDYEIKYSSDKVKITVYDAKLNKSEYTIKLIDDTEPEKEIKEYDNTKSIIIFLIFLSLFILILLIIVKKHKKERID